MKRRFKITIALAALLGVGQLLAQNSRTAEVQFKEAQHKEQVEGDLKGAIEQYKKIAQGSDRRLAAKALVAIGECYERLGSAEARAAYDRVVREFADQPESATQARARLAALQGPNESQTIARRVWAGSADSVSLDGRYLSYTDWETGDVAIRDLITRTDRHLTNDGAPGLKAGFSEGSIISPDNRQVAYNWWSEAAKQDELRIIAFTGAENARPQTVYASTEIDYIQPAGWTPDGKQLLVVRSLKDQTIQLGMVSIQDKSIRVLKSLGWSYPDVDLSHDGRYIAYAAPARDNTATRNISILAVDGGRDIAMEQRAADNFAPVWSPDGSRIVFLSDRTGTASLWTVPVLGGKPSGPAELLKANVGSMGPLGIAKNGTLYYTSQEDRRNIYIADLDAAMKVTQPPVLASERFLNSNGRGAWSRDGRYFAYYSFRSAESAPSRSATLVIRTVATGEERDIPLHPRVPIHSFAAPPRWFPDGRSVLVAALRPQQSGIGYYRVDLTSGDAELLQHTTKWGIPAMQPDLSPDGKTIFYAHDDAELTQLIRFDIDSRRETKLRVADGLVSLAVSPDGTQLAYLQRGSIEVMPAAGGEPRTVYRAPGVTADQSTVVWMPAQRDLLFVQSRGGGEKDPHVLWRVPLNGDRPEEVGIARTGGYPFSPQMHPDGRRIMFESHEGGDGAIWTLENFLPTPVAAR